MEFEKKMNIIEAIKSGKKFKRKQDKEWCSTMYRSAFSTEYILADDWEVEEEKIPVSLSDIEEIYVLGSMHGQMRTSARFYFDATKSSEEYNAILKRLGFVK